MSRANRGEAGWGCFFVLLIIIVLIGGCICTIKKGIEFGKKEQIRHENEIKRQENENREIATEIDVFFKGEHKLRRIVERSSSNAEISGSGGFFLFVGGATFNGKSSTEINAKFAWDIGKNVYTISSLPLEKIRVEIDEKATIPMMRFKWNPSKSWALRSDNIQQLIDESVVYVTVRVKEEDWPAKINLLE